MSITPHEVVIRNSITVYKELRIGWRGKYSWSLISPSRMDERYQTHD